MNARMVKSADTADLKSADHKRSWGFKSPSGHHEIFVFLEFLAAGEQAGTSKGTFPPFECETVSSSERYEVSGGLLEAALWRRSPCGALCTGVGDLFSQNEVIFAKIAFPLKRRIGGVVSRTNSGETRNAHDRCLCRV